MSDREALAKLAARLRKEPTEAEFDTAGNLVAVPRLRLQHAQNEELGKAHFDEAIPIGAVGVVHRLSARSLCLTRLLCHTKDHIP